MIVRGKYRQGWSQKLLGRLPFQHHPGTTVWFHAVSVGEVLLLQSLIPELRRRYGELNVVISTTTHTGQDVARNKYPDCTVCYCPLDFSWAVKRSFQRIKPDLLVLVELELWPNLIREASDQKIPIAIINGRLSEKSYHGYRKIRPMIASLLQRFQMIAVQNEIYASRFRKLGAGWKQVEVTGSVKFDQIVTDRNNPETKHLRELFRLKESETIFIAGSTQSPEEDFVIKSYKELKPEFPNLRLIVVPRHQERFEEVASLIAAHNLPFVRRSNLPRTSSSTIDTPKTDPVILLDTLGELGACWGLADLAYVGGSLTNRGGQNMIEPAAFGAAVMFGPNTHNFRDAVFLLKSAEASAVIPDGRDMTSVIEHFLRNPGDAQMMGARARKAVLPQQGATGRTVNSLISLLPERDKHEKNKGNAIKRAA